MSAVVAGTKAKLQNLLPGRIGDNAAFSDSYVSDIIMAGYNYVAEKCNLNPASVTIALVADQLVYDLDSSFIDVTSVTFWPNGDDEDGELKCVSMSDLDRMSRKWRDDRGTRPEYYTLLSAPGIPETSTDAADGSQIVIYRAMSTVSDDLIQVYGFKVGVAATGIPEDIQRMCLVPYALAHLKAVNDPRSANDYYSMFKDGLEKISGRFNTPLNETPTRGSW